MTVLSLALLLAVQTPAARPPTYWGDLQPGRFGVGFRQRWIVDSTRRLVHGDSIGLRHRPILVNVWYPAGASGRPMPYDDYFRGAVVAATTPALSRYARALADYERRVARQELGGTTEDSGPDLQRRIDALFASSTAAIREAPPKAGRYPVVVYTSGSQSSYDENIALCEYLASHGFVVVGSAYPNESNDGFATDSKDESRQRDIRRLIVEAGRFPFADVAKVVAIGHSAGAQALLVLAADPSTPLDAVLALDTTEDYTTLADRTFAYFTDRVLEMRTTVRPTLMFAAGPEALFELADSVSATERWLVEIPNLLHSEYLTQGVVRRELRHGLPSYDATKTAAARASYDALVRYVERWLTAFDHESLGRTPPPVPTLLRVTRVARGVRSPSATSDVATSREMRHVLFAGAESTFTSVFLRARRAGAASGSNDVLYMLLAGAMAAGKPDLARRTFGALAAQDSTVRGVVSTMANRARLLDRVGAVAEAAQWWSHVATLDSSYAIPDKYRGGSPK